MPAAKAVASAGSMTDGPSLEPAVDRRGFIAAAGAAALATGLAACDAVDLPGAPDLAALRGSPDWERVRADFVLSPDTIHMSAMLISSHPRPVREAIERHRRGLDRDPVTYLESNNRSGQNDSRSAAASYLGVGTGAIALTDSTTMGVGLVYNGFQLHPGDQVLSTEQDYFVTIEALRQLSQRTGARVVEIPLYDSTVALGAEEAAARVLRGITDRTRVVALTWVHSSTGFKLPARLIADAIGDINGRRPPERRIFFCLDGVHGFGVEDVTLSDLGCDFFMAGCHKWLFGPRGTGIIAAGPQGYAPITASIPSFLESGAYDAWIADRDPGPNNAQRMTPGGFKAFEHYWALKDAFEWQRRLGKRRVAERTHELARQLKEGLRGIDRVVLHTPMSDDMSSGIVAFDVDGLSAEGVVRRLRQRNIIASVAPYAVPHARLTPSIRNTSAEVDEVLRVIRAIA